MSNPVEYRLPQIEYDPLTEYVDITDNYLTKDEDIIRGTFIVDLDTLANVDDEDLSKHSYFKTVADSEFMDASLGGHVALGMPYAFTRHGDIPKKGILEGRTDYVKNKYGLKMGMSKAYAEMFQLSSKSRILTLEFGKPRFRSMFAFFSNSVDYSKAIIANEGRTTMWYNIGMTIGVIGAFLVFPGLTALYWLYRLTGYLVPFTDDRYYSFKSDMHNYLQTANIILTQFQVERGLVKSFIDPKKSADIKDRYGVAVSLDTQYLTEIAELAPDIYDKNYGLNIYNIIARPQLIVNQLLKQEKAILDDGISNVIRATNPTLQGLKDVVKAIGNIGGTKAKTDKYGREMVENTEVATPLNVDNVDDYKLPNDDGTYKILDHDKDSWSVDFGAYMDVISNYGMENISLYVDYVGPSEITFSNEIGDIPAKSVINNIGSASRDVRFSLSGGNILGDFADEVGKAGRDIIAGTLNGATFGLSNVIMGLLGGGYLSFPKHWKDSSVTLPTHTFKMRLGGPYGNPLSLSMDIDVISSLLFAGVAPLSTGNSSYTSPYLCKAFMRGLIDTDFGMITSLTYKAGDGAGRNIYGQPLEVELSFTITVFEDIATAPVNSGFMGVLGGSMNDNDALSKFIRGMGGRSYANSRYITKKTLFRLAEVEKHLHDVTNPAKWATMVGDSVIGDIMKISHIGNSVSRIFE